MLFYCRLRGIPKEVEREAANRAIEAVRLTYVADTQAQVDHAYKY